MAFFEILNADTETRKIQRRMLRDLANPFHLPDQEFLHNYRINKDMALYLCRELEGPLTPQVNTESAIPVHIKVLCAIKFMAGGSYQRDVGQDHNLCIAQRTMSKHLGHVVAAINERLMSRWIVFPGNELSRRQVASGFLDKFGLPDILGAIDCTHVSIFPPPRPHGLQFINRKGKHTINVQLIADVDCKLLHVNAEYPGDSGYGLEPWLMTPVLHAPPQSPEDRYTRWHCQARNVVERTNGYLKGSLRCLGLDRSLHYSPENACRIIYACCTIYNIMKHYRVEMREISEDLTEEVGPIPDPNLAGFRAAIERRNNIINTYFN